MEVSLPEPLEVESEREVIQRVLAGETEEFRLLVLAYQQRIFTLMFRQLQCETSARDLTQETFLRAFRSLDQFRGDARFSTWLTRIAINVSRTYFSSRRYRQKCQTVSFELTAHEPESRAVDDCFDEHAIARLYHLAQELTPKLREVFVLCALEQRPYREVAELLDIPIGTVRSRLNKARMTVRKKYFEEV